MKLTVAIIARDEAHHIGACLASVHGLAAEVLVLLDVRTRDATAEIGERYGARVLVEPWRGFPAQRNRALDYAQHEWVLFLDADERVTPALHAEIRALLEDAPLAVGYAIPRWNRFFGTIVRGGGWYPDHQVRLLLRSAARYDEQRLVHELVQLDGPQGTLREHLLHENIERLDEFGQKQSRYAYAEALTLYRAGTLVRWRNLVGAPAREFRWRYVQLGGWRDGALGLFLCAALAWFALIRVLMLRSLDSVRRRATDSARD
jgi:glycosyltransferase involved in cell wall biosynthesis